jgi:hypothetical protein
MVIVLDAHDAVTPEGRPVAVPMPVAPVVASVMGVREVLMHRVGAEAATNVFSGVTVIVPVAVAGTVPQPPVRGML